MVVLQSKNFEINAENIVCYNRKDSNLKCFVLLKHFFYLVINM